MRITQKKNPESEKKKKTRVRKKKVFSEKKSRVCTSSRKFLFWTRKMQSWSRDHRLASLELSRQLTFLRIRLKKLVRHPSTCIEKKKVQIFFGWFLGLSLGFFFFSRTFMHFRKSAFTQISNNPKFLEFNASSFQVRHFHIGCDIFDQNVGRTKVTKNRLFSGQKNFFEWGQGEQLGYGLNQRSITGSH